MQGSKLLLSTLSITALVIATSNITQAAQLNQTQAQQDATDAYIYGYPLITMNITRQVMTNVSDTTAAMAAPMGQFANVRTFPDATFKTVTAPNADTLYSVAWLNLAQEPYVLHVPDEHGRYYMMPMLSGLGLMCLLHQVLELQVLQNTILLLSDPIGQELYLRVLQKLNHLLIWFGLSAELIAQVQQKIIKQFMQFRINIL